MNIAIDHQRIANQPFVTQGKNGDGSIVEDTKAFACTSHGMMRTAGEVDRNSLGECSSRGGKRCAATTARTFHHFLGPGKADTF